jgi:DNA-directed RNA polymerase specialized sigma24 family protein
MRDWDPEKGSLATYLSVITVRTAINFVESGFHKSQNKIVAEQTAKGDAAALDEFVDTSTRTAGERLHRLQVYETFLDVLNRLEEHGAIHAEDRRLLIFRLVGLSYKEIEALIGLSVGTATRRFSRLKPVLKEALIQVGITQRDLREEL